MRGLSTPDGMALDLHERIVLMLLVRREIDNGLQAHWSNHALRDEDLIVVCEKHRGAIFDEAMVREIAPEFATCRYILRGVHWVRCVATGVMTKLEPGDMYVSASFGMHLLRAATPDSETLSVSWRRQGVVGDALASYECVRPSTGATPRFLRLARALSFEARDDAVREARSVIEVLRAEGLPLNPSSAGREREVTYDEDEVSNAIERALPLALQPTGIDLARVLDVGEAHALRRTNQHLRRFYHSVSSWRDYLRHFRLYFGAFFMGRPLTRTEDVARALGFRSPTSFCHAFHRAGLPSPQRVQAELLAS